MSAGGGGISQGQGTFSIERFENLSTLGTGAFGSAFHVRDVIDQSEWALKVSSVADPKVRAAALSEAAILHTLSNPHVVDIRAHWEEGSKVCILLELCRGSLSGIIKEARDKCTYLCESFIVRMFMQLCTGVSYVHSSGILHRDIKSANILWQQGSSGELIIKLADFGISRHLGDGSVAHTFIGSPFSLSPEILNGSPYNSKSDMWACGCVLYELCALGNPFGGKNPSLGSIVSSIFTGSYPPLHGMYSPELGDLISALFTLDPAQRPDVQHVLSLPIFLKYTSGDSRIFSDTLWTPPERLSATSESTITHEAGWGTLPVSSLSGGALSSSTRIPAVPSLYDTLVPVVPSRPPASAGANPFTAMAAALRATQQQFAAKK
jgi:serine/threonine protein kinase